MSAMVSPADLEWGAFSDHAPWVLDRSSIEWLPATEGLRADVRHRLPSLTKPSMACRRRSANCKNPAR